MASRSWRAAWAATGSRSSRTVPTPVSTRARVRSATASRRSAVSASGLDVRAEGSDAFGVVGDPLERAGVRQPANSSGRESPRTSTSPGLSSARFGSPSPSPPAP